MLGAFLFSKEDFMDFEKQMDYILANLKDSNRLLEDLVKGVIDDDEYDKKKRAIDSRYEDLFQTL